VRHSLRCERCLSRTKAAIALGDAKPELTLEDVEHLILVAMDVNGR
jgi:hypothetical protein